MCGKTLSALAVFLVVFSGADVQSQDTPSASKHLKPIESFIGVWKARFDPSGVVPEGDLEIHFQWKGNKSYIESSVYFHPDGAPNDVQLNLEFTVVGYDTGVSAIKAWHFKQSLQGRTEAKIEPNRLVIHQQEGQKGHANFRLQSKTYVLDDPETLIVTEFSESDNAQTHSPPPLRLKKSSGS